MADRSHVSTSLPCPNYGCDGYLKCHGGSKLIPFDGGYARKRLRICERCYCKIETTEFQSRVINRGTPVVIDVKVLSETKQRSLFD